MRKSTLLLLVIATACGGTTAEEYLVIRDFLERAAPVECRFLDAGEQLAVTGLRPASDSTVLVLDGPGRRLVELDARLGVLWELEAPSMGPGALNEPVDAVVLGDTAVMVAERTGLKLIVYSRSGELVRSTQLPFVPHALAAQSSGDVLVSAMPVGGVPANLVFRFDGEQTHEILVSPRHYEDPIIASLGNSTLVDALETDEGIVVHQFLSPRGFRVGVNGEVVPLEVPTPDATLAGLDFVPSMQVTRDERLLMLLPAAAMSIDRGRSQVYLLTRSGRIRNDRPERAILRLDEDLRLLSAFTIDVFAVAMAYLPGGGVAMVVDDQDRFFACPLPRD